MKKKGEMGIGTLIIFIAMILVAAIAAGVLIQTAGSLQNKALITGDRSKTQVSTAVVSTQVYAEDGTSGGLEEFFAIVKLAPGSDPIKFSDSLVTFDLTDASVNMEYGAGACVIETGFDTDPTTGRGNYTVEYLILGSGHLTGYLVTGDVAKICMRSPRSILEDEMVRINIVPKTGSPASLEIVVPEVINQQRMFLYP